MKYIFSFLFNILKAREKIFSASRNVKRFVNLQKSGTKFLLNYTRSHNNTLNKLYDLPGRRWGGASIKSNWFSGEFYGHFSIR